MPDWGNIFKMVGGAAAVPFTGGATIPLIAQGAGGLLSGAAKGAASERGNQNEFQQRRDALGLQRFNTQQDALLQSLLAQGRDRMTGYQTQQGATTSALQSGSAEGLQRAQLGLQAPGVRARQSVLGSLMSNMQPVSVSGGSAAQQGRAPQIHGGLSATALDPQTRAQGQALLQQALQAQLTGSDVPGATDFKSGILAPPEAVDYSKGLLTPPELSDYKKAGKGESWLAGGGLVASILGQLLGAKTDDGVAKMHAGEGGY